jgi:hypothetical protein
MPGGMEWISHSLILRRDGVILRNVNGLAGCSGVSPTLKVDRDNPGDALDKAVLRCGMHPESYRGELQPHVPY